jgi:hypothetical protein
MEFRFNAEEWQALSPAERIRRCRVLASEAETLADHAAVHLKTIYLELAMQWKILAEEMKRHELQSRPGRLRGSELSPRGRAAPRPT